MGAAVNPRAAAARASVETVKATLRMVERARLQPEWAGELAAFLDLTVPQSWEVCPLCDGRDCVKGCPLSDVRELARASAAIWPDPRRCYVGSNKERQAVGRPGHCERCATLGHIEAHPELGCADVGCNHSHEERKS